MKEADAGEMVRVAEGKLCLDGFVALIRFNVIG